MTIRNLKDGSNKPWICECYPTGRSGKRVRKRFATTLRVKHLPMKSSSCVRWTINLGWAISQITVGHRCPMVFTLWTDIGEWRCDYSEVPSHGESDGQPCCFYALF